MRFQVDSLYLRLGKSLVEFALEKFREFPDRKLGRVVEPFGRGNRRRDLKELIAQPTKLSERAEADHLDIDSTRERFITERL